MTDPDFLVTYTTWSGLNAKSASRLVTEPWGTFVKKFSERRKYKGQWNHPGWSGATFSQSHRKDENVTSIRFLVLDFDHDFTLEQARGIYIEGQSTCLLHTTKSHVEAEHAFRVIFPLSRPVTPEEHAKLWAVESYRCSNKLDPEPKAISQFFYQPGVLTDESIFIVEETAGELLDVDTGLELYDRLLARGDAPDVTPQPAPEAPAPAPEASPKVKASPKRGPAKGESDYRGKGILFAAFENRNWIGKEIDSDKCAAKCPWESSHTPGKGSESSTVLYYAKPGHEMGYLHCSHAHCNGRTHDDLLVLFSQDELDEARRIVGLPAFRAPKANVKSEPVPPADDWIPSDDDDPRAPPKGSKSRKLDVAAAADGLARKAGAKVEIVDDADGPDGVTFDPHKFSLTDLGNAERLVRDHGENQRYCAPKKKWYVWQGTHWQQDDKGEVLELAKATVRTIYTEADACDDDNRRQAISKHAVKSEHASRISAMVDLARTAREVAILPHELDADPWLFCCDNGTINLKNGELLGHRKQDLISRISPVAYDPKATSEVWESYLLTATGEDIELQAYLKRAVGYALQGTVTEKKFFFIHGPANSGKSVFINGIAGVFGPYHEATSAETWLAQTYTGGNRGDVVRLVGTRLATANEFRKGARFDEGLIKKITGGDAMAYAKKYEDEVSFTATFALWMAANDPPAIRDDDVGMWSRVMRIPFVSVIPADRMDHQLGEKLRDPKAQSAILRWAVEGCLLWQRDGLGTCAAVDKSSADYRAEMDRAVGFFDEECVFARGQRVLSAKIRKAYEAWCDENTVKPLSGNDLAQRLVDRGCANEKSHGHRYWVGVRLIDDLDNRVAAGSAGSALSENPSHGNDMGRFHGNGDPGDPGDPRDDEAEYQAEIAWRGEQC